MRRTSARRAEGVFVVEGSKLLAGALEAGARVESVFVGGPLRSDRPERALVDRAVDGGDRLFELSPGVLERVADTVTPQPVLAVVAMPDTRLEDLGGATFVVVCVDVRDPGNAGAVIRVADAAGAEGVVCCEGTVDPFNPKTVRASAGSVLQLPVVAGGEAGAVLRDLGEMGLRRLGATSRGGEAHTDADWRAPLALVLGNEASGLPSGLEEQLDGRVTVAMGGRVESLNVSTAAAVLCFEVARSRSNLHAMEEAQVSDARVVESGAS
jgi:TrmH family RNA methyltransferase